jgi:hypothetical protein
MARGKSKAQAKRAVTKARKGAPRRLGFMDVKPSRGIGREYQSPGARGGYVTSGRKRSK